MAIFGVTCTSWAIFCTIWFISVVSLFALLGLILGKLHHLGYAHLGYTTMLVRYKFWSDRKQVFGVDNHRRQTLVGSALVLQVLLTEHSLLDACSTSSWAIWTTFTRSLLLCLPTGASIEQRRRETHGQIACIHLHHIHSCPLKLTAQHSHSSSSHMRFMSHNWSATKQRLHPQSVAEISRHSVLSGNRIQQCETSSVSHHKDTDQCL